MNLTKTANGIFECEKMSMQNACAMQNNPKDLQKPNDTWMYNVEPADEILSN